MESDPQPPRCGHIGALSFTHITAAGEIAAARPIPCRADATHIVDLQHYRCADHLVALLDGDDWQNWEVRRLAVPLGRSIDAALTDAGAPCTLDRFQERHASDVARIELIAAQRDQLKAALAWLDADSNRLAQVSAEIRRQRAAATDRATRNPWLCLGRYFTARDPESYAEMQTPTVGQVIAELAGAALGLPNAD